MSWVGVAFGMAMVLAAVALLYIGPWNAISNFRARRILQPGSLSARMGAQWISRDTDPATYWMNFGVATVAGTAMAAWLISIGAKILLAALTR